MTRDPEIAAMETVGSALEPLEDEARERVIEWALGKFGLKGSIDGGHRGVQSKLRTPANADGFETFADLYDAARPSTDAERALVSAYWHQVIVGEDSFPSQPLNTALKNLGHPVKNITDALTSLKSRTPALVLQLQKRGNTRQARKTYKLTTAGIRAVESLVTGGHVQEDDPS